MKSTEIYMCSKLNAYAATGVYENGIVTVYAGSRINPSLATHVKKEGYPFQLRNDRSVVDANGVLKENYVFQSPSAAAQFVSGRIANGYITWRVDDKHSLKKWLAEQEE